MKRVGTIVAACSVTLVLGGSGAGDDAEEIRKATRVHMATLNAGDAEAHIGHHLARHSAFRADGGRLEETTSLDQQRVGLRSLYAGGFKSSQELRDLKVEVYGSAAVVTAYVTGSVTLPSGETRKVAERRTAVLVKQDGEWKEVHLHSSPLTVPLD